jgi:hypothetical protein
VLSLTTTLHRPLSPPGLASPGKLTKDVPLTADMSVAPEIARLAETLLVPAQPAGHRPGGAEQTEEHAAAPLTLGTLVRRLRSIAAAPERWWSLVRFEPGRPVEITVEDRAAYRAWLVVMPPGDAGRGCDCDVATMIAGEATDGTPASAVLRPGPVRVHGEPRSARQGEPHRLRGQGTGYSISLHARARRPPAGRHEVTRPEVIG